MGFKYRLEPSLRLAKQEMDLEQGLLAKELRILQEFGKQRDGQAYLLAEAMEGQKKSALEEPANLGVWQKYVLEQKRLLQRLEEELNKQENIVVLYREKLIQCRIKVEKYKKLKQKKIKIYNTQELKKEQAILDEIAQSKSGRK